MLRCHLFDWNHVQSLFHFQPYAAVLLFEQVVYWYQYKADKRQFFAHEKAELLRNYI